MILFQSKLFSKTRKELPQEAKISSHRLLMKAGFIDQLSAGIWSLLPLGFRVQKKIEQIIRQEMEKIEGQEILLPSLQPKNLWLETDRWHSIEPPLFVLQDRHKKEFCLGPTHEEVVTDLARKLISSYKQLPLCVFQIQNKFRNEIRSSGGLLRVREFIMKDLYSFHSDEKDLNDYYQKVHQAYLSIFKRCDLKVVSVQAEAGSIGGNYCHEFMVLAESGEDKILSCPKDHWAINAQIGKNIKACPQCKGKLKIENAIEAGHIFKLGDVYTKKMNAFFQDKNGRQWPILMGCYGIGLGRLLATVVEVHHDQDGLKWPENLSPFCAHILPLTSHQEINIITEKIIKYCQANNINVLYDDRDLTPAQKLKDADLIGIYQRIVISQKTAKQNLVELKIRSEKKIKLITLNNLFDLLKNAE